MNKDLMNREYLDSVEVDTIYILAPGPNGQPHWKDIPEDAFIIYVNKAIELLDNNTVPCGDHLWLVPELSAQDTDWFYKYKEHNSSRLCVGRALVNPGGLEENEYFKYFDYFGNVPGQGVQIVPDKLNTYGTVSSMAMQLAYHLGAKSIILVGVDMWGDTYYDGDKGFYKGMREDRPWYSHICGFDELIRDIKSKGVEVCSLSPTQLLEVNNA